MWVLHISQHVLIVNVEARIAIYEQDYTVNIDSDTYWW